FRKCARDGSRRGLRLSLPIDQPERPVVDIESAAPPLIGPAERDGAAGSFGKRCPYMHRGEGGLPVDSLSNGVDSRLGEEKRFVSGDVLQAHEIGAQFGLAVQVDVEGADVEE